MTKKQIIIVSVIAAVLIISIIAIVLHDRSSGSVASAGSQIGSQTQSLGRREIPSVTVEANQSEETDRSKGSNNSSTNSSNNTSLDASGTIAYDPNLFKKISTKTAPPETSGYPIPKSHHFSNIEGSSNLKDKDQAKLAITIDTRTNFDKQLQELYNIVEPVLGADIAEEIVAYAKTKTNPSVVLDKWWQVNGKEVQVSSSYNSNTIEFLSWDK